MNTPLSILLPVHNAQRSLEARVAEILEVLPELTPRFELCILDDGSMDDTAEIAHELAALYPQINVIRHPVRLGLAETIQTGLDHTQGEIILVSDADYCLDPDDLRTLWQLRDTQRRMSYRGRSVSLHDEWMEKLLAWKPRRSREAGVFQIIDRHAFEFFRLQQASEMIMTRIDESIRTASSLRPNFLGKVKRFAWGD